MGIRGGKSRSFPVSPKHECNINEHRSLELIKRMSRKSGIMGLDLAPATFKVFRVRTRVHGDDSLRLSE